MLQVLWERGWIDEANFETYTLEGPKNVLTGIPDVKRSLKHIMSECHDFKNEMSVLEFTGESLGVKIDFAPKFHAELAGEGIEYSWGYSKGKYRREPLKLKKGRRNFVKLVKKYLSPENELTNERVRKFSARARAYINTYYYLGRQQELSDQQVVEETTPQDRPAEKQQLIFLEIERLMKEFKTHRCALDFDRGFINSSLSVKVEDNTPLL